MKRFKVGDHVMISPSSVYWGEGDFNPSGIEGVVTRDDLNVDNHIYQVEWDNDVRNVYREEDLVPYDEIEVLLEEARRRFKPGCRYLNTNGAEYRSSESDFPYVHSTCPIKIAMTDGKGLIYDGTTGKWGEVIEEPISYKFKVGDRVIGNERASEEYSTTKEGWVGYVVEALLDEARRRFKPGCRYLSTDGVERQSSESDFPYVHSTCPTRIALASGQGLIYDGAIGEWGEVIPGSKACKGGRVGAEEEEPAIPFKHPYDNCVIEVLDADHGREVIEWWQSAGISTGSLKGSSTKKKLNSKRFYGLHNDKFSNYSYAQCESYNLAIIELPSKSSTTKGNIHSQIKTKQNGNTKQQAESGKTIKVQRVDLQIRKGSIGRRAGLKGSGVEVSIGNRHRNHKTRSILG